MVGVCLCLREHVFASVTRVYVLFMLHYFHILPTQIPSVSPPPHCKHQDLVEQISTNTALTSGFELADSAVFSVNIILDKMAYSFS